MLLWYIIDTKGMVKFQEPWFVPVMNLNSTGIIQERENYIKEIQKYFQIISKDHIGKNDKHFQIELTYPLDFPVCPTELYTLPTIYK